MPMLDSAPVAPPAPTKVAFPQGRGVSVITYTPPPGPLHPSVVATTPHHRAPRLGRKPWKNMRFGPQTHPVMERPIEPSSTAAPWTHRGESASFSLTLPQRALAWI